MKGIWATDLRPTPKSEAYYKEFKILTTKGQIFSGEFYGSPFENGQFNSDWVKIYFAFPSADQQNTYYHSGFFEEDKISGVSFSADRKFLSHWSGYKK